MCGERFVANIAYKSRVVLWAKFDAFARFNFANVTEAMLELRLSEAPQIFPVSLIDNNFVFFFIPVKREVFNERRDLEHILSDLIGSLEVTQLFVNRCPTEDRANYSVLITFSKFAPH